MNGVVSTDQDRKELLERFAPGVWLHFEEDNFPQDVGRFIARVDLYQNSEKVNTKGPLQFSDLVRVSQPNQIEDPSLYLHDRENKKTRQGQKPNNENQPPCYASVRELGNGLLDIQYWFFYPYNGLPRFYKFFGDHVGDWEHYTVRVDTKISLLGKDQIVGVYASAHDGEGLWLEAPRIWTNDESGAQHPVVFSAYHSHANYHDNGDELALTLKENLRRDKNEGLHIRRPGKISGAILPDDFTSPGTMWKCWKNIIEIRWSDRQPTLNNQDWVKFTGDWGQSKSPVGPAIKDSYKLGDPNPPTHKGDAIERVYKLPGRSGVTNLLTYSGMIFAAAHGHVFQLDSFSKQIMADNDLEGSGQHEVRLAVIGEVLYAGINGAIFALDLNNGLKTLGNVPVHLPDKTNPTSLLVFEDRLFAAAGGRVFEVNVKKERLELREEWERRVGNSSDEIRMAADNGVLWAAANGFVYPLDMGSKLKSLAPGDGKINLPDRDGITNIVAKQGKVFAAAEGRVYGINPITFRRADENPLEEFGEGEVTLNLDDNLILYVGLDGDVIAFDSNRGLGTVIRHYTLPDMRGKGVTNVLFESNMLFATVYGSFYQLDAHSSSLLKVSLPKESQLVTSEARLAFLTDHYYAGINGRVYALHLV
ncbi:MAG: Vps62-related protein [Acidobacteriota bacterium]